MAKRLVLLLVLISTGGSQIFTPHTQRQCNADLDAWQGDHGSLDHSELSFEQLFNRSKELLSCEIDFPKAPENVKWMRQRYDYSDSMASRYQHFMERNKLFNQFLAEDESGKR